MKYEFSEQEVNVLIGFIDLGVKSGGLKVSQNAVILAKKLSEPFEKKDEKKPEENKSS